jgi:hypothetical protein
LKSTKKPTDWTRNTAEKSQPLAACSAAVTAHKLGSAQPKSIKACLNKQVIMMAYLPQTNEALNPWIGRLNSNHDKDSGHHWPPDVAVIRDRVESLILSSPS